MFSAYQRFLWLLASNQFSVYVSYLYIDCLFPRHHIQEPFRWELAEFQFIWSGLFPNYMWNSVYFSCLTDCVHLDTVVWWHCYLFEFTHRMSILPETGIYVQYLVWYYPPSVLDFGKFYRLVHHCISLQCTVWVHTHWPVILISWCVSTIAIWVCHALGLHSALQSTIYFTVWSRWMIYDL